jgi:ATP-binding cassette, subfamily C (CFTR/MRP), member 1
VRIQAFIDSAPVVDGRLIKDSSRCSSTSSDSQLPSLGRRLHLSQEKEGLKSQSLDDLNSYAVMIKSGAFGYDTSQEPKLKKVNLEIPIGKLTMLVGPVGSGKSTMLKAILGEVQIMDGSVYVFSDEIAYCDQTPWHMNATIRDSIIAFSPVDESRYQQVLEACELRQDLTQFPEGDGTAIGSKGIILSGGQSHRIVRPCIHT